MQCKDRDGTGPGMSCRFGETVPASTAELHGMLPFEMTGYYCTGGG